jgi:hypothetical protein
MWPNCYLGAFHLIKKFNNHASFKNICFFSEHKKMYKTQDSGQSVRFWCLPCSNLGTPFYSTNESHLFYWYHGVKIAKHWLTWVNQSPAVRAVNDSPFCRLAVPFRGKRNGTDQEFHYVSVTKWLTRLYSISFVERNG